MKYYTFTNSFRHLANTMPSAKHKHLTYITTLQLHCKSSPKFHHSQLFLESSMPNRSCQPLPTQSMCPNEHKQFLMLSSTFHALYAEIFLKPKVIY